MDSVSVIEQHADVIVEDITAISHEDWLRTRKRGIGGSDAAAALGLSPYTSPYALWCDKTSDWVDDEDNEAMEAGRRLEGPIGHWYSDRERVPVQRFPKMLQSHEHRHMLVNLDFLGPDRVVECKNVGLRMAEQFADGAVPDVYNLQGQHSLAVTGLPAVDFAVLIGGQKLRAITVERDDALIDALITAELNFWKLVQDNTPPAIDGSDATTRALKQRYAESHPGEEVELPMQVIQHLRDRAVAKAAAAEAESEVDRIENTIKDMLGNAEIGTVDGRTVVTWKQQPASFVEAFWKKPYRRIHVPK